MARLIGNITISENHLNRQRSKTIIDGLGIPFWLSICWIMMVILFAAFADILPLAEYDRMDFVNQAKPPGILLQLGSHNGETTQVERAESHYLGTDTMGRDITSRLIYGARVSLTVGLGAPLFGLLVGGVLGMMAGYYRGKIETCITILMDILLAFPGIVLLLVLTFYLGTNLQNIVLALGILTIPYFCRVARASTLKYAKRDFIYAARMIGRNDVEIIVFEILPNVIVPLAVYALIVVSHIIVAEGVLSYLGLSVPSPFPSWGGMIAEGREMLGESAHVSMIPALVMCLTILAFNLIGDTLRSSLDVRQGQL